MTFVGHRSTRRFVLATIVRTVVIGTAFVVAFDGVVIPLVVAVVCCVVIGPLLDGFTVRLDVEPDRLTFRRWPNPGATRSLRTADIRSVTVLDRTPLRHRGPLGYHQSFGYAVHGGPCLVIARRKGSDAVITLDDPEGAKAAIEGPLPPSTDPGALEPDQPDPRWHGPL
jgi:hypothetical protein